MAPLFNRFRRAPPEEKTAPQVTSTAEPADSIDRVDSEKNATQDPEKPPYEATSGGTPVLDGEDEADLPDDVKELPKVVRNIVSLEDDPNAPTITFRYFVLCALLVPPGAILFQMGQYRTTAAAYPVLFVQIGKLCSEALHCSSDTTPAGHYLGYWLAKILPKKTVRVPFTKFSFSLNPGPWSAKGTLNRRLWNLEANLHRERARDCDSGLWCNVKRCLGTHIIG